MHVPQAHKIRCDGEYEKFCKIFWEQGLRLAEAQIRQGKITPHAVASLGSFGLAPPQLRLQRWRDPTPARLHLPPPAQRPPPTTSSSRAGFWRPRLPPLPFPHRNSSSEASHPPSLLQLRVVSTGFVRVWGRLLIHGHHPVQSRPSPLFTLHQVVVQAR